MIRFLRNQYFWLALILMLALFVRLYKINNPIADWHAWRQADTAAVSRIFYQEGYNPLVPKYQDMSGVAENPVVNLGRYRLVEFPIYNSLVYFAYLLNGGVDEKLARLVAALFSLGSLVFVYLIAKKYFGKACGLLAGFLYATLPFNIYFSRVILPEPSLVFFCLGMFFFLDRWIFENRTSLLLLSIFFTASAFLTKPMAIFYLLPLLYSYHQKEGRWWPIPARYFLWLIPSFLPLLGWRLWISQHPEGIPASNWLFNGTHIRFRPAFWKWIIGDRFGREILSAAGTFLFFFGLLVKPKPGQGYLLHLLGLSMLLYLIVFATGNVQHDYYQYLIIPALVIFVARGFLLLAQGIPGLVARLWTIPLAALFLVLTLYLTWTEVKGLYQINNPVIVEAGQKADQILPKSAVVLAPYNGDSSFLYYVNRPGFANTVLPITEMTKRYGITSLVSTTNDTKTAWAKRHYLVLEDNPRFSIIDLTKPTQPVGLEDPEP